MIDEKNALEIIELALTAAEGVDQAEVILYTSDSALTRFSGNRIHQNVAESNARLSVRAIIDKRIGHAATNKVDEDSVRSVAARAVENAKRCPPNPEFTSLPKPQSYREAQPYSHETVELSPEARSREVSALIEHARGAGMEAAGSFSNYGSTVAIGNTLGVRAAAKASEASLKTVIMGEDSSGYASTLSKVASEIDGTALAKVAIDKAVTSRNPIELEPGIYPVVLAPEAVADIVAFLAYAGFSALALQEGRSFMAGKLGEKLVDDAISIWDDGLDDRTIGLPFDFEGVPKRRIDLITKGVASGVVYDSFTANREGRESTGHALPAPNPYGPLPTNLFMAEGDKGVDEMIASIDKGVFITRFHYTNIEDPLKTVLTGMTRDGTFLIENGAVKGGVKNLRFTQSVLGTLSKVIAVSAERTIIESMLGAAYVPHLALAEFNFTGATQF